MIATKTSVVIPAYNEERQIRKVLDGIIRIQGKDTRISQIIVINDGSTDKTADVLHSYGSRVRIINNKKRIGVSESLNLGYRKAVKDNDNVLVIASDGQHNPDEIPKLLDKLYEEDFDFVIGSRFYESLPPFLSKMPIHRYLVTEFLDRAISFLFSCRTSDCTSGFRAMRKEILDTLGTDFDGGKTGYVGELELLLKTIKHGFKIGYVKTKTLYKIGEDSGVTALVPIENLMKIFSIYSSKNN